MHGNIGKNNGNYKHGMYKTKLYRTWGDMMTRCNNQKVQNYKWYGGKGIKVCSRWFDFRYFMEDMYDEYLLHIEKEGEENTTLERMDNNKNYELQNCRWATWQEQYKNKLRNL